MNTSMGERLAWARNQQALILQQVSERSGLAIGYISQLEKGAKKNPTIDALGRLANALNVSVAWIMGEVPGPDHDDRAAMLISGQAYTIRQRFNEYYTGLAKSEWDRLALKSVEERFALVVDFLCREFPDRFTRPVVAYQLGLSVRALNDVLERGTELSPLSLTQISRITGIPSRFFAIGQMEAPSGELLPLDRLMAYAEAIALAAHAKITPEELVKLIRELQSRK